jgi:non-specific serine/threonine protein kinase
VWLVALAALTDPMLVTGAVASALDVSEQSGQPLVETLAARLRGTPVLLVLDNCEHLVEACARLTQTLLEACGDLRVLATSREALGVAGEAVWQVPALSVSAPGGAVGVEELLASEAARLFVDRAALARPGFEVTDQTAPAIARLCRRLEGIPLAIELAAARMKVLTVDQILERLDDRFRLLAGGSRTAPSRQQTLRATLDWSYELLTDGERALLQRLSVFSGGWTLEAAEAALGNDECGMMNDELQKGSRAERSPSDIHHSSFRIHHSEVLTHLERLADKSLVIAEDRGREVRYRMLETIREYTLERLSRSGHEETARRGHADYFLAMAETSRREVGTRQSPELLERLEAEHDNIRAALRWFAKTDSEGCLRLAVAVRSFWYLRGHLTEGRRWLGTGLEAAGRAPARVLMQALQAAGNLALLQGDLAKARAYLADGVRVSKEAGDLRYMAWTSFGLGVVAMDEGDLVAARASFEESLATARAMGDERLIARSLNVLGEIARLGCDWAEARSFYEQAVASARQEGERDIVSTTLCNLGAVTWAGGDVTSARSYYREALTIDRELGHRSNISYSLDGLAAVAVRQSAWERAGRLAGAAEALREEIGYELEPVDQAFRVRYLVEAREHLGEAALETIMAAGRAMTFEQAIEYALSG